MAFWKGTAFARLWPELFRGLLRNGTTVKVDVCQKLLNGERMTTWASFIIAQDEKWISYEHPDRKLKWLPLDQKPEPIPKRGFHAKKELLSFFFCSIGCIYYEILPDGYCCNIINIL
ncbi:hypothetical protein OESDEN_07812 [Oesophagostomum dentatum]|uniref:Uncharacterized protein n=1 Tax=Oesophagostomum dentatum TaxID=61180 RepID=A0A0B1T409_OESDE|nr:hypothetical protein OESDEN_07812 [Oesophagostomum dentatum]